IVVLNKAKERMFPFQSNQEEEDPDIKKIKKVQSFMRGWLCRRKWKIIVQDYICSPHAESMRKRNQIVFNMVEAETEYVHQLSILVNCFLRPLRMAASSKKPPISHDDVSSIFLNSETIMFLHEIFHQGLKARIANWPTLVLADLFDILLPMLNIYQEFVRNHQYSLQVLANCKQNRDFDKLLKQYEYNAGCEGRMLETFLTYPMFQIPRYIITLHELLAHTPHEHVERKSLEFAKSKLEELSNRMMHDEVSDTENIRKNLAIERMIVEGCDILLDTSQTFVRQGSLPAFSAFVQPSHLPALFHDFSPPRSGSLIQLPSSSERGMLSKVRLGSLSLSRIEVDVCCRTAMETPFSHHTSHMISSWMLLLAKTKWIVSLNLFRTYPCILGDESFFFPLQCIDNIRCNGLMTSVFEENSKVSVPHMINRPTFLHSFTTSLLHDQVLSSSCRPAANGACSVRISLMETWHQGGTLSLIECTLIEELDASDEDYNAAGQGFSHLEFKIVVEPPDGQSFCVVLLAPSRQEKAAWTSDISQCIDNIRCNGLMTSVFEENSKVSVPHMIK
uniref:Ras protein specific guanine nucleotide releasing factor 2 n=1 Tax=Poecilia formosa TaxID=48698 RepID=A0A096M6L8_POEFO